jgi:hypothetical protein
MKAPGWDNRLNSEAQRRDTSRTHYLWRDKGESREDIEARFQRMIAAGRAQEGDDYIIFRWNW